MAELSLTEFASLIPRLMAQSAIAEHEALRDAALVVQKEAKDAIGHYQETSGPFVAWAELAEVTKADRVAQGYPENEPELRTGELRDSIEYTVGAALFGEQIAEVGSNDDVMVYQELGTEHMPPRSILGGAAARKEKEVVEILGEAVFSALIVQNVVNGALRIT